MACIDALSQDNYLNINKSLAKLFGLQTAAYWAALSMVLTKVKKKKKFDERGFFKLDRKFIQEQTTLSVEEQLTCDKVLVEAGIVAVDESDQNRVSIDAQMILSLIINNDVEAITKKAKSLTTKVMPKAKKLAKSDFIKATMKQYLVEPDETVFNAYCNWIDVIADSRRINRVAVETFQKTIKEFSTDKETQKKIIELATAHTYIDAHWAINTYEKMCINNPTVLKPQKVGTEINKDVSF